MDSLKKKPRTSEELGPSSSGACEGVKPGVWQALGAQQGFHRHHRQKGAREASSLWAALEDGPP